MFILCQKKDTIVNLKKVQAINIHLQNRKEVCAWFDVNENNKNSVLLGVYETEERAKEVLEEITEKYENIELAKYDRTSFATRDNFIYRMPKE